MTNKTIGVVVVALGLLILGIVATFSYLSPQRTLQSIKDAIQANDTEALRELVDFDSVRSMLKEDLKASAANITQAESGSSDFSPLALTLSSVAVDSMVDAIVTPPGLINIISKGQLGQDSIPANGVTPASKIPSKPKELIVEGRYEGLSRYIFSVRHDDERPEDALGFFLRRNGIFTWKLTRMSISKRTFSHYLFSGGVGNPSEQSRFIAIDDSDLSPVRSDVLRLTATLQNRAAFALNYPLIEITLTDAQGSPVARRVLMPKDYLSTDVQQHQFGAYSNHRVELGIKNLSGAVGYQLYIFYSSDDPQRMHSQLMPESITLLPTNTLVQQ